MSYTPHDVPSIHVMAWELFLEAWKAHGRDPKLLPWEEPDLMIGNCIKNAKIVHIAIQADLDASSGGKHFQPRGEPGTIVFDDEDSDA